MCFVAVEDEGGAVVGACGVLGGGEGAEPAARALAWLADLGYPLAPAALSYSSVLELAVVRSSSVFLLFGGGGAVIVSGGGDGVLGWVVMVCSNNIH